MLAARQAPGGVIARKSGPSSTSAPTLRSSLAIAASRSVSLTRQLAMLRSLDGPSAKRARAARVIAASGRGLQSRSIAASGQRPRRTSSQPLPDSTRAHRPHCVGEGDVALDRSAVDAFDAQSRIDGADRRRGDEVRRRRRVALDDETSGRAELLAGTEAIALRALALDGDAEGLEQLQGDLDVGLGDQLALDLDHRVGRLGAQRQGEQQGGEELARDVAAHPERRGERERALPAETRSGGKPAFSRYSTRSRARAARRPGRRSAVRACAATPRSSKPPPDEAAKASAAVRGRIAVPALPRKKRRAALAQRPPRPCTVRRCAVGLDAAAERARAHRS